jgi:hypothetical protein
VLDRGHPSKWSAASELGSRRSLRRCAVHLAGYRTTQPLCLFENGSPRRRGGDNAQLNGYLSSSSHGVEAVARPTASSNMRLPRGCAQDVGVTTYSEELHGEFLVPLTAFTW